MVSLSNISLQREREPLSFETVFYSKFQKGEKTGRIYGFPMQRGAWCNSRLKMRPLNALKNNLRGNVLSHSEKKEFEKARSDIWISDKQNQGELVYSSQDAGFSNSSLAQGANTNIVQYLGIAADEPERIERHTKPGIMLPLVDIDWDEAYCRKWCEENDLLSPIYKDSARGGCWFCHNQGIDQLRLLRKNYPELWTLLMKWDKDSPVTFHADGRTVHDFEKRFSMEDLNLVPSDKKFRWKMLSDCQGCWLDELLKGGKDDG